MADKMKALRSCMLANHKFIKLITDQKQAFHTAELDYAELEARAGPVSESNMSKVRSTLRQCVRDWSEQGARERATCYGLLASELDALYRDVPLPTVDSDGSRLPAAGRTRCDVQVLTPGAGLGRLTWEIARLGFCSQGNEFSYFMLMASFLLLNCLPRANYSTIYPFVHTTTNLLSVQDQLMPVSIPDVDPSALPHKENLSMVAGDFLEAYSQQVTSWDAVVTCYFIDTAHNILEYLRMISLILKPGGYWLNFGPLLYHFADTENEDSVELSWEEIRSALPGLGFRILKEQTGLRSEYTHPPNSMLHMEYECVLVVCVKVAEPPLLSQAPAAAPSASDAKDPSTLNSQAPLAADPSPNSVSSASPADPSLNSASTIAAPASS